MAEQKNDQKSTEKTEVKVVAPVDDKSKAEAKKKMDHILVAEDSAPNRTILVHLIKKLGFEVIECVNGKTAWDALQAPEVKIVAVLSDIMMPEMDGVELLKRCRADERYKEIPFVLVTAVSDKEHIVAAKTHGVQGYILKPVTFQRVTAKLQEIFTNRTFPKLAG